MTSSQIKSYVAAGVAGLAVVDANTLNLLSELLTPGWAKAFRVAAILAGIVYTGKNQSWSTGHVSLPRTEAEALAGYVPEVANPVVRKAVARIRKQAKGSR